METRNDKTDKMPMSRVILMSCGRYNPPTHMHLRMFERARDHLHGLRSHKVIGGVISPVNDHCGKDNQASSSTRCDLLKLALKTSNWIRLSTWEIRQKTAKSTRETLRHHQNVLNSIISNKVDNNVNNENTEWIPDDIMNNSDQFPVQIKLLCGSDLLESFLTPGQWSDDDIAEIVGQYGLVIIGKEGGNPNKFIYDSDILSKFIHNIHVVTEWIPNEVNATRIRTALRRGESVKYLLQNDIIEAIYEKGILDAKRPTLSNSTTTTTTTRMSSEKIGLTTSGSGVGGRVILMSCGSYNPPTHMHLRMFERARDHLHNLGSHVVVGGVISPVNDAYAKKDLASGSHRVAMLRLALGDSDWIRLSTWEIRQTGWTRTRQSLQHHQSILDSLVRNVDEDANSNSIDNEDLDWVPDSVRNNEFDNSPVQIKLLCGGDLLESFATPGLWLEEDITEIVSRYGLIVITREGSHPYKFIYDSDVLSKHLHNIQIVTEWILNEVSSTRIRRALKRGESVKYLLQDPVIEYVYDNGIYGAERPSTIKLSLSSNHSSTDYLDAADESKMYHPDNAFQTPSPSDITMLEASPPCLDPIPTLDDDDDDVDANIDADVDDDDERVTNSVLEKNEQNLNNDGSHCSSPSLEESTELAREKFFRSIVNDLNDSLTFADSPTISSSSSLLLLNSNNRMFSQIDGSVELPSSARARNELLAFEDAVTTESELATLCGADTTTNNSEDREDVLSVTYEESSDDLNLSSSIKTSNNARDYKDESTDRAEDTASSVRESANESLSYDDSNDGQQGDTESQPLTAKFEIDGKYIKSLVNSKKSGGKKVDDDDDNNEENETVENGVPKASDDDNNKSEQIVKKEIKFEDDLSYIKKLRLVINSKPTKDDSGAVNKVQRQLQGSLDSINLRERDPVKSSAPISKFEAMSKKSKSFESIKRYPFVPSGDYNDDDDEDEDQCISYREISPRVKEDFCSACCYESAVIEKRKQPVPANVFYSAATIRSSDEESTECDICSSCNLRDSNDEECKSVIARAPLPPDDEVCEICGEPAAEPPPSSDRQSYRPMMPFGLPKAKSTIEISRGSYPHEDDSFEIDNCGQQLQDCKLRASLDVCNKPEPLYVNVVPRYYRQLQHQPPSRHRSPYSESAVVQKHQQQRYQQQPYCPQDETSMQTRGNKRLSRRGSYANKRSSNVERTQEKRRFSSADNLQNRASFKSVIEKTTFSRTRDNKFMTSADCISNSGRPPLQPVRSRSLRRSADNVGRFDSSGDNLDSLEETTGDTDENNGIVMIEDRHCAKLKLKDSDTIRMILTKHGIKVISQKETVL